jgi:hypothetical protein
LSRQVRILVKEGLNVMMSKLHEAGSVPPFTIPGVLPEKNTDVLLNFVGRFSLARWEGNYVSYFINYTCMLAGTRFIVLAYRLLLPFLTCVTCGAWGRLHARWLLMSSNGVVDKPLVTLLYLL